MFFILRERNGVHGFLERRLVLRVICPTAKATLRLRAVATVIGGMKWDSNPIWHGPNLG